MRQAIVGVVAALVLTTSARGNGLEVQPRESWRDPFIIALADTGAPNLAAIVAMLAERDRRYEERFTAMGAVVSAAFAAAEKAIDKAERAQQLRNEAANEFREQLTDQAATFVTLKEVNTRFASFDDRMGRIQARLEQIEGRTSGISATTTWGVQFVTLLIAVAAVVWRKR